MKQFLEAGKITGTHGLRGELRVELWCDGPDFLKDVRLFYFDSGEKSIAAVSMRPHKNILLLQLEGIDTVEKADAMRGRILYINRDDVSLPEGKHFIADLIGLQVVDGTSGRLYGRLEEVLPTGANDVYRVKDEAGREYLFPAVRHMIKCTDLESGRIEILPIPGIFDENEPEDGTRR